MSADQTNLDADIATSTGAEDAPSPHPVEPAGLDWLGSLEQEEPEDEVPGSGRVDFVVGAALVGVNFIVTATLVVLSVLQSVGLLYDAFLEIRPAGAAADVAPVIIGSLLGLAVGIGGFAFSAWKRWPSYYWPLFGIAIALGSVLLAR